MSCLVRTRGMASESLADFGALLVSVTILGNASLHRPQPLDLKVRVCVSVLALQDALQQSHVVC